MQRNTITVNTGIDELTRAFDGTHLDQLPTWNSAGAGFPILCGGWSKSVNISPFEVKTDNYFLIRMLPHSTITEKMVNLIWQDDYTLHIILQWPSFFFNTNEQVTIQDGETEELKFGPGHQVFTSITKYLRGRVNMTDASKPKVFEKIVFNFPNKMDRSYDSSLVEVLKVEVTDDHINTAVGEELPPGNVVKMVQIILRELPDEEETPKTIAIKSRDVKLGTNNFLLLLLL